MSLKVVERHSPMEDVAVKLLQSCSDRAEKRHLKRLVVGDHRIRLLLGYDQLQCIDENFISMWSSITEAKITLVSKNNENLIQVSY